MSDFKTQFRRFVIPLCALLLLAVTALLPPAEKKQRLRIAPGMWPGAEALLLAHTQKKLPANQFQMIELPWSSAVMHALGNGAVDVAVVTLDSVLRMREAGQQLRVLLVLDESAGADAVIAQPEIKDVHGLRGKRVGVDVRGVGAYLLVNALEEAKMTLEDVQVVPLIQPEMEDAMQSGQVAAVVVSEPWLTRLRQNGLHRVYDSNQLNTPILRLIVTTERTWQSSRGELTTLLQLHSSMTKLVRSGESFDGLQAILRREKLSAGEFAALLARVRPLDASENSAMLAGASPKLVSMAAQVEDQMIRHGLLRTRPVSADWIDPMLFKEAFP